MVDETGAAWPGPWIIWKRPAGQWAQAVGQWAQAVGQWAPMDSLDDAARRRVAGALEAARARAEVARERAEVARERAEAASARAEVAREHAEVAARAVWPASQGISWREPLTCDDAAGVQASDLRRCRADGAPPQASDLRLCRNMPLTCDDAGRGGTDSSSIGPLLSVFVRGRWRLRSPDQGICSVGGHNRRSEPCGATSEGHRADGGALGGAAIPARATAPSHGPEHSRRSGGRR